MRCLALIIFSMLVANHALAEVRPLPAPKSLAQAPAQATEMLAGMSYLVIKPSATPASTITAEYAEFRLSAWTADGNTRFNSQQDGNLVKPVRQLAQSWPALARAILVTPIGETRRWWISAERMQPSYRGAPMQSHVLELTVIGNADPVPTPKDVGAPPPDVEVTASGLAYKVLKRGKSNSHPSPDSTIEIDYSGWTRDGKLFDSSILRGEHTRFPLTQLIRGWQEGILLMSPGDSFRFWIPGHLAYDGSNDLSSPRGMLVFDITLYGFEPGSP